MKLLTKEILNAFKKQGDTSEKTAEKIKVIAKFFNPTGAGTWYLYEYDGYDIFWCFANLGDRDCAECGTVSLSELKTFRGRFGLGIERDMSFPIGRYTLQEIIDKIKQGEHV